MLSGRNTALICLHNTDMANGFPARYYQGEWRGPPTFFGDLLRSEDAPFDLRLQAAKELAYVHPQLQSVGSRPGQMSHEDRLDMLRKMLADADAGD